MKNVYEILEEFRGAGTKQERIAVLKTNESVVLKEVLKGTFDPVIQFVFTEIPKYKENDVPPDMSYLTMYDALKQVYLYVKDHPRVDPNLTQERKTQLLIQLLEAMEPKEAKVFCHMLQKDLKVPYLTKGLVDEVFTGLLP